MILTLVVPVSIPRAHQMVAAVAAQVKSMVRFPQNIRPWKIHESVAD